MKHLSGRASALVIALTFTLPVSLAHAGQEYFDKAQAQDHAIQNRMMDMTQQIIGEGMKQGAAAEAAKQKRLDKSAESAATMDPVDRADKQERIEAKIEKTEKAIAKLEKKIEKLEKKRDKTTDPDKREAIEESIEDLEDKKDALESRLEELEEQAELY